MNGSILIAYCCSLFQGNKMYSDTEKQYPVLLGRMSDLEAKFQHMI